MVNQKQHPLSIEKIFRSTADDHLLGLEIGCKDCPMKFRFPGNVTIDELTNLQHSHWEMESEKEKAFDRIRHELGKNVLTIDDIRKEFKL